VCVKKVSITCMEYATKVQVMVTVVTRMMTVMEHSAMNLCLALPIVVIAQKVTTW